jgi:hypothetical protein
VLILSSRKNHWTTYPDKNALYGKLLTRTQYMNCTTPESIKKSRKESINLRRSGVFSAYAFHSVCTAFVVVDGAGFGAIVRTLKSEAPSSCASATVPERVRQTCPSRKSLVYLPLPLSQYCSFLYKYVGFVTGNVIEGLKNFLSLAQL